MAFNRRDLAQFAIMLAAISPSVSGCDRNKTSNEQAYYSGSFELSSRDQLRLASASIKSAVEKNCGLIGHERPIYRIARRGDEFFLLFQSHNVSGELTVGAIAYSSMGREVQVKVELFASGFVDLDSLLVCKSAIEDLARTGFSDLVN